MEMKEAKRNQEDYLKTIVKALNENCEDRNSFGFDEWDICHIKDKYDRRSHCSSLRGNDFLCKTCSKTLEEMKNVDKKNENTFPQGIFEKLMEKVDMLENGNPKFISLAKTLNENCENRKGFMFCEWCGEGLEKKNRNPPYCISYTKSGGVEENYLCNNCHKTFKEFEISEIAKKDNNQNQNTQLQGILENMMERLERLEVREKINRRKLEQMDHHYG